MSDFEDFPEIIDDPDILETKPTYPKSKGLGIYHDNGACDYRCPVV